MNPEAVVNSDVAPRKGVFISTYGCQMNVNDTERMFALLEMENYSQVMTPQEAELIIINSCSVREKPVHKVHSELGQYKRLKSENSRLRIGVGGCVGQQEKSKLLSDVPFLDFVFGPDNIDTLPVLLKDLRVPEKSDPFAKTDAFSKTEKIVNPLRKSYAKFTHDETYQIETLVRNPGVSVFVNITKGCDNFCSFCVVPFTRGRLRSRPLEEILRDIHGLVKRGVKEVTVLGQNVNSYESPCGAGFSKLMETIATETGIQRLRFTTSHPKDFTPELVDTLVSLRPKVCDYIHLPVQSGNSDVLARMNRGYSVEKYMETIRLIQEKMPGVALSTDIIVGFPGETDAQFEDTLQLVRDVGYDSIFAFKYSPRPFTKALKYTDHVSDEVMTERLQRLLALQREVSFELAKRYQDKNLEVLVENVDRNQPHLLAGRSTHNKLVQFEGEASLVGQMVMVRVTKAQPLVLLGERVQ